MSSLCTKKVAERLAPFLKGIRASHDKTVQYLRTEADGSGASATAQRIILQGRVSAKQGKEQTEGKARALWAVALFPAELHKTLHILYERKKLPPIRGTDSGRFFRSW